VGAVTAAVAKGEAVRTCRDSPVIPYTARLAQQSDDRNRTSVFHHGGPSSVPGQPTGVVWWAE
jgi:hypothetical protein